MACTRFNYDDDRTKKRLQQQTDPGKWILNVPGNGSHPAYMEDPQIIIQKWGANLRTNTVDLESSLLGVNHRLTRDCLGVNQYTNYNVPNEPIQYPDCRTLFTEQARATHPAWMVRDLEQVDWYYPPLNPQENVCYPFENNLNTRILEKDGFQAKRPCLNDETLFSLPTNSFLTGRSGEKLCSQTRTCSGL